MSFARLVFSSDGVRPLSALAPGARGTVVEVRSPDSGRVDRLVALGVTPGASIALLQAFPAVVFVCDQTELAVERGVADTILVRPSDG
jgi:DtxR family Mn-dependent transcriptional regulator